MTPECLYSSVLGQTVSFQSLICLELQSVQSTAVQTISFVQELSSDCFFAN